MVPPPVVAGRWAVVIGVGEYENTEVPRLRYAVPDAEAMYQLLIGPAGFKKEHVLLLTDTTEKRPTLQNIKRALGTFLARSARKDDTVVIFFAGHGAPEVDPRGIEADGLAKYLIPIDADPEDLFSTALPMDDIHTIFSRIESERVVVFLDTCYSGAAGGRTFASKKRRERGDVDELFLERLTRCQGASHHHRFPADGGVHRAARAGPRHLYLLPRTGVEGGGGPQPRRDRLAAGAV